jgi:uncharacterized protein (DUF2267 family)
MEGGMMSRHLDAFDHAQHTAHAWLVDIGQALDTDDRRFAYRVLRAWLHALRDRLTVEGAVAFAAQLPELLRGVYYDGWQPHRAPAKYGPEEYVARFAREARISTDEVRPAASIIAKVLAERLSPGQLAETLAQLPVPLRTFVAGTSAEFAVPDTAAVDAGRAAREQLADLEARVDVLTEAIRTLAAGLELAPGAEADQQRRSRAGHLATEMLLAVEKPPAQPTRDTREIPA